MKERESIANTLGGVAEEQAQLCAVKSEIAPGMTTEEINALFLNDALIEPSYRVFQLNSKGHRYYYVLNEDGNPTFYPSVTTILSQTMPTPPHLVKWIADKGYDEAEAYKMERASYGTFMHAAFEELIINRTYNLDELKTKLYRYMEANRLPDSFINYADDLKKDVLAFARFVKDYDVRPIAVEIALVHPAYNYAGMIDLPCSMLAKPGNEERINAIVDFKSGRKGFFEEHEIQLHLYRELWNANFPNLMIDRVFNFSPKDWRKKPTYNLKDQTESPNARKMLYILELAAIEDEKRENVFTHTSGVINLDSEESLENNVVSLTLAEIVKGKAEKTPEEGVAVSAEELEEQQEKPEKPEKSRTIASSNEDGVNVPTKEKKRVQRENVKNNSSLLNDAIEL